MRFLNEFLFMPKNIDIRSVLFWQLTHLKNKNVLKWLVKKMSWQSCVCNKPYHIRGNHKIYREFHLTEKDKGLVQCSPPQSRNVFKYFLQFRKKLGQSIYDNFDLYNIANSEEKKSRENIAWEFHYDFIKSLTSMWHAVLSFLPFTFACIFREKKVIRHHLLFTSQYALATTVVHSGRYINEFIISNTRYVSFSSRIYVFILLPFFSFCDPDFMNIKTKFM